MAGRPGLDQEEGPLAKTSPGRLGNKLPGDSTADAPPLLYSKLHVPCARTRVVPRPRLLEQLDRGLDRKLTLISAPAGFGKTTLLASWRCRTEHPIAALSLDRNDNDPSRFWTYFIGALQTLHPGLGQSAAALLNAQLRQQQQLDQELFLTALINDISGLDGALSLVLEDFHLISSPAIHHGVEFFLDHMPLQLHLILTSRADPPLPLARMRAQNQLMEIRAKDLRFTTDEAAAFLNEFMGLHLSADNVTALDARTEGWIVGLQFAALSIQGRSSGSLDQFIAAFTGSHRFILDYLAEEVFNTQPENVRRFLLETSFLDRLSGPLCDAVTGRSDSAAMLARLERNNLFTIPLDERRQWYRYHQLFADVLRHWLEHEQPGRASELQKRASDWFGRNGFVNEAMSSALAVKDFERAARLIEGTFRPGNDDRDEHDKQAGFRGSLLAWLDALPGRMVRSRPLLSLAKAWATVSRDRLTETRESLADVERWVSRQDQAEAEVRSIAGEAAAVRSIMAVMEDDALGIIDAAQRALSFLPEERKLLRGVVKTQVGIARLFLGDIPAARKAASEGLRAGREIRHQALQYYAYLLEAGMVRNQGNLCAAVVALRKALEAAQMPAGGCLPIAAIAQRNLADVLYEMNDLEASLQNTRTALGLGQSWLVRDEAIRTNGLLARIQEAKGDGEGALEALARAEDAGTDAYAFNLVAQVGLPTIRAWLARDRLHAVLRWKDHVRLDAAEIQTLPRFYQSIAHARLLIALEQYEPAVSELAALFTPGPGKPLAAIEIEARVLQALALQAGGNLNGALDCLGRALTLARPEGYVRTFVDEGEAMRVLLHRVNGANRPYASALLGALESRRQEEPRAPAPAEVPGTRRGSVADPLSKREVDLLPLLAAGHSNQEIARKLYISTATVKVHLKRIYAKLDVHNRSRAIARARELNLL